jgi:hypothetical protein
VLFTRTPVKTGLLFANCQASSSKATRSTTAQFTSSIPFILTAFLLFSITSCKSSKQAAKGTQPKDSSIVVDTSHSELGDQFDSLKHKVSSFLSSLLPPSFSDTTKPRTVLTPPSSDIRPPAVSPAAPSSGGFLSTPIRRRVEFNPDGSVTIRNQFLNSDVDVPMTMSFSDYLKNQQQYQLDNAFREGVHDIIDTSNKSDPNSLLGGYNNITIPIPPSIVPSIFGKPSINLRINGDVAVHIAYRDNQFLATSGALFSGSETGLDFKQEINVSTNGTIGDKLKIGADWGSERSFQYENLLKLGYTGFPDEIIQSLEAGNVSMNTPSQYIGTQQALFGLKAVTRFGPLYVTSLVAQKKGDRQSKSFGGGAGSATATEHIIQPASYKRNSFFVDTGFVKYYEQYYSTTGTNPNVIPTDSILYGKDDIQVWRGTVPQTNTAGRLAIAWYNLGPRGAGYPAALRTPVGDPSLVATGLFLQLDSSQWSINPNTGVLSLSQEPNDQDIIAVSYSNKQHQYGEKANEAGSPLILKMVKPKLVFQSPGYAAWRNILKNSYYVGGAGFSRADFSARILFTQPTGSQTELVRSASGSEKVISALGLDRQNNSQPADQSPDGLFDNGPGIPVLDEHTGTITFPYLEPFGSRVIQYFKQEQRKNSKVKTDSTFYFPQIYTNSQESFRNQQFKNAQISINVKFAGGVSSQINLNAFNLVEGSVRVSIAGHQLTENSDYRVDYNSGTITMLKPDLLSTGQLNVDYETHDIFTNATKSVLGLRGEIPLSDKGLVGLTFMNYSMKLPSIKTRQGEEPLSNWILGFDGSYKFNAPAVTDLLNYLPIFNLKEKSELSFKIDAALSLPNPNTQASPLPDDNGASIAYLDDFEGGKNEFPLSMSYGRWVNSSQPIRNEYRKYLNTPDSVTKLKAKTWWYEKYPADVPITDIKPNRSTSRPGETAQVMDIVYDPTRPGAYNHSTRADFDATDPLDRWGGIMQYASGLNVQATNTDAIEFWMKIDANGGDPNGIIHFDLGRISEDVIPDGVLETEDKNRNGRYDPDEDVGLDTISNDGEKALWPNAYNPDDPNNDNYNYSAGSDDYSNINGTEGNQNDKASQLHPDTEDLDNNSNVDLDNSYYEYKIPINPAINKYIVGQSPAGWYQFHIPLVAFDSIIGVQDSSFSNISYFRFWFSGFKQQVHLRLNEVSLVGSQWTRATTGLNPTSPLADSTFRLGYVNIEDNALPPTNYKEPNGAQRDRLAGQTNFVLGNEQSLNMSLRCVNDTGRREAQRVFQNPNDLFNYRSMAIFVHGDDHIPTTTDTNRAVWAYVRLGTNEFNYYEYRRPLTQGWQNIHIDFAKLTGLKAAKVRATDVITESAGDGVFGATYTVVGSPTLTNAPVFTLGVQNKTGQNCLYTDVWWDELRLLEANDKADWAMNGSTQLKLAEFGKINASIVNERADFHRVDERFNVNRALNFNWNVTGEFAMQKIFPKWLENQSVFPLTISHTEVILRPKYLPNTDVEIQGAVDKINQRIADGLLPADIGNHIADSIRLTSETLSVRNSIGASGVRLVFPGSFFLLPAFVNRLTYGFGYAEEFARSPQFDYNRSWSWTGTIAYDLPGLPNAGVSPFTWWGTSTFFIGRYADWKINFLPQSLRFGISATRGRVHSLNRVSTLDFGTAQTAEDSIEVLRGRVPFINRTFTATRGIQATWKLTENGLLSPSFDYGLDVTSNLAPLETDQSFKNMTYDSLGRPNYDYDSVSIRQRELNAILRDIFFKDGALVRPGRDIAASQRVGMTTSPRLPWFFGLDKFIRPVFSYRVDYRWQDAQTNLQYSKVGAWNNTITTGLEFNVRDLGVMLFGKPGADEPPQRGRGRGGRGAGGDVRTQQGRGDDLSVPPEEVHEPGMETRPSPFSKPQESPRNQDRGEEFRPQARRNPLARGPQLLDTLHTGRRVANEIDTPIVHSPGVGTGGERDADYVSDTTLTPLAPITEEPELADSTPSITIKDIAQALIQKPFFDWNGTRFNFTQTNTSLNPALQGQGSGITNFLARGVFSPEFDDDGPSRAYQLGLITDPHGRLLIRFKPQFPFVAFTVRHGNRAPDPAHVGSQITDVFTQQNNFELSTSRPLWEGASLSLNWKLQFSYDERNQLQIDKDGLITPLYVTKSGDVSRTFLSIPPIPFLSFLTNGIQDVGRKYEAAIAAAGQPTDSLAKANLSPEVLNKIQVNSFMTGFETLPFFSGLLREYLPRLNYSFNWVGLEKFPLFSFCDRASFRHAYNGNYRRSYKLNPNDSNELTTLQTLVYGFRPLIALDLSWDKFYGGKMTASFNYDTQTEWAADYSSQRITRRLSTTFGITANWNKQGLTIPFLKLNLKNEVGASFTLSQTISEDSYYEFGNITTNPAGTGNGGLSKLTIEPRVSYTVSQQLTLEGFYRYERTTPAASGIISPPTRLIMAGIDIRLKIQ